jgi:hypothetical protein
VRRVAALAQNAEVASYDCTHFAIYAGPVFEDSVTRQVAFLRRHLTR